MDWTENLKAMYGENEPILFKEIYEELGDYTRESAYRLIRDALKNKKLARYDSGVYYIPTFSDIFGMSVLSSEDVFRKKYITDGKNYYGFYTGNTILNIFGLSTQVPSTVEIITNNESTRGRTVDVISGRAYVKKSRTNISNDNYRQLMLLETFNLVEPEKQTKEFSENVITYMKKNKLLPKDLFVFAEVMPARAIKNFASSEVLNAFT
ncbi:MAG TPA: DUF6088 family protein [Clostridia bacterium]|jgi:hypothetical protein|nr:DUF6088 family protein [Clostridia bacterium]